MGNISVAVGVFALLQASLSPREVFSIASESVVTVVTSSADGTPLMTGSGVHIGGGAIVTNCHVLEGAEIAWISHGDQRLATDETLASDPDWDVCVLKSEIVLPAARTAPSTSSAVGDRVYAIGSPRGLSLTLSDGLISGKHAPEDGGTEVLQVTTPISPGSSGGGLFNEYGQLIGITTMYLEDSQQLNFAIPIERAIRLIHSPVARESLDLHARPSPPAQDRNSTTSVAGVETGTSQNAKGEILNRTEVFEPGDGIYLSVPNNSRTPVIARVAWVYGPSEQPVVTETKHVPPAGRTVFHIHKPDGWPVGVYSATLDINGRRAGSYSVCVQDESVQCVKQSTRVYRYTAAGRRHYTSKRPASSASDIAVISVPYWTVEPR